MNTISTGGCGGEECPPVTTATVWEVELIPCPVYDPPPFNPSMDGIRDAARAVEVCDE